MRSSLKATVLAVGLLLPLAACKQERAETAPPPPAAITADAIGHYCGMNLHDHPGPKGQVIVKDAPRPIWLSSVRDTFAFTMLPEEPKEIRAIYVTDMTGVTDSQKPNFDAWVEARKAWYVLDSGVKGGMGASEPLPFATEAAARAFAATAGGKVKRFTEVTDDEILTLDIEPAPHPAGHAADTPAHATHGATQ